MWTWRLHSPRELGSPRRLTRPGVGCTLLGPRDVEELEAMLRGADRFLARAGELSGDWDSELTASLLDPSRWSGS